MTQIDKLQGFAPNKYVDPEEQNYFMEPNAPIFEFSKGWGRQWEGEKEKLNGMVIVVVGTSEGDDFGYAEPSVVILFHVDGQDINDEPWGMMFGQSSPVTRQALGQARGGLLPFRAQLIKVASDSHKGQSYWTFRKAPPKEITAPKGK